MYIAYIISLFIDLLLLLLITTYIKALSSLPI